MKVLFFILLFTGVIVLDSFSQQPLCADAEPFCTDSIYNYPLATGTTAETGPDYDCLATQPNPVWYFLQISQAGDIGINIASTPGSYDVDFACWGPFSTATGACTAGLTAANIVDCSYSTASVEDCYIPNAQVGEFYMLVITNYSNQPTDVQFSQTSGTGATDCSIVAPCSMTNITVNVGACDPNTNTYDISGTIDYIDPPATGNLIIEDDAGYSQTFNPTPNFISPTNFTITGIPADGATHTLYAYFTDDSCNYTITYTAPSPCMGCITPPGSINATTPACYDSPVTFTYVPGSTYSGATFQWDFGTGASPATANTIGPHTVTYSIPGTTPSISLTVTDSTCAPDVINTTITIPSQITVSSTNSTPEDCGQFNGTITIAATGGTGTLSYDIGTGANTTGSFTGLAAGAYTVTVTDSNNCTVTEVVSVGAMGSVTGGFTATANQCLTGNTFDFTNTGDTGTGITWSWSFPGGTPSTSNLENPTGITWSSPGQYDIVQTAQLGGCQDVTTITIEVYSEPVPTISVTDVTCSGYCDGTATVDASYAGYLWTDGSTSQSISGLCDGQYCVTVTDANGCTGTVCATISQPSGITIDNETTSDVTCFGDNDGSVVVSASGGTSPLTYDIGITANSTGSFTGLSGNTYTVTITDANNCTTTSNALTVNEPPVISINSQSYTDVSCFGYSDGSITLSASGGAGTFSYSIDGIPQTTGSFTNLAAGNYTVTITDINGCTTSSGFTLSQPQEIVISITPDQIICNGQTANISVSVVGGNQPYTYMWSHANINVSSIAVSPTTETVYSVYVQDSLGCISESVVSTVSVSPPIELSVTPNTENICPGESAVITIQPSAGIGPPYTILVNGNMQTSPYTVYPNQTTTYDVTATDACGSTTTQSTTINVYSLPPVNFSSDILNGCQPLTVTFIETNQDFGQTYSWNFGDSDHNNLAFSKSPEHTYEEPGTYTVSLTVVSPEGCSNTEVIPDMITVYPNPTSKFIASPEVVSIIKPVVFFTNYSLLNDTNYWYFGDGDSSNALNPYHTYPQYPTGTYTVELVTATKYGCRDTVFSNIQVEDEYTLYAPTAFSPDFDGINDVFNVKGNGIDPRNFHLLIYDRWGEVIFETKDINQGWDGRVSGGEIGYNSTFTWLVIYKDTKNIEHQKAGAVTIIR